MRHLAEYRDAARARRLADEIDRLLTRRWAIMEVCGGQTHSIRRHGIDDLLPREPDRGVEMIHGPGCPVCVTPLETIDRAVAIARIPGTILCSYGDMLRVPGSSADLLTARAEGSDVRIVASPLDALALAASQPGKEVVMLAIGFETTAPAHATAAKLARSRGIGNFSLLVSHVLVPPAMTAVMRSPGNRVQAFLAAGHVCSVMGTRQYPPLAEDLRVPIVVTGFEPVDLLEGIRRAVAQLESGRAEFENAYGRVVTASGNEAAQAVIAEVFAPTDRVWRGIGPIPRSGWRLSDTYRDLDAAERFDVGSIRAAESPRCRSGDVLRGTLAPDRCPAFGTECTPATPLGATMVSSEGACAAYHLHGGPRRGRRHDPTGPACGQSP